MGKPSAAIICGHGKSADGSWDCGCRSKDGKLNEAALMLPITNAFVKYAKLSGIEVYTDGGSNHNNKNMLKCVSEANKRKCDAYISLHCDYYKAPAGTLPITSGSVESKKLCNCLNKFVKKDMKMVTRGIIKADDYEVTDTIMPACIFETGSIGIASDVKKMKDADDYGKALAKGLCEYLGVKFNTGTFKVRTKGNLIVREHYSLDSKMLMRLEEGNVYTIVKVNANKTRGQLKTGGWITITDKFVKCL